MPSSDFMLTPEELRLKRRKRRRLFTTLLLLLLVLPLGFFGGRPTLNAIKAWQARRHAEKAFAYIAQEKWNEARGEAVAAYRLRPTEPEAIRAVARFLSRTRQPDAPAPTPVDARRDWGNTGTDFNTNANWSAGTGGVAPGVGDVAWFTTAAVTQPNLSASLSISGLYFNGTGSAGYNITNTGGATFTLTGYATSIGAETGNDNAVAIGGENTSGTNTIAVPLTLAPASGSTSTIFQAGGGTLIVSGAISGTATLNKDGAGTLVLSGNNTYSGDTVLNAGQININSATAIGTGEFDIAAAGTVIDNTSGAAITLTTNNVFYLGNGNLTFAGTNDLNLGTGAFFIADANRTVSVTDSGATLTIGGIIQNEPGSYSLTKAGAGTLLLTNVNTYSGGTIVSAGTLKLSGSGTLGSTSGTLTVNGGTLDLNGTNQTVGNFTGSGGTILNNLTATNVTLTIGNGDAGGGNYSGVIADHTSGTGTVALTKTGLGTITLSGANTYTGGTTINGGSLRAGADNVVSGSNMTIMFPGSFDLNSTNQNIGALSGDGSVVLGSGILTANNNISGASTSTYDGVISGTGQLVKAGTGTLTLTGASTYTGTTTVNSGTLLVNGDQSAATGAVFVNNSGTTLGGTGTIGGAVTVASSARLLGGTGAAASGTLTLANNLTMSSGSIIQLALGGSGAHSTLNRTGGTWSFDATQAFTFIDFGATTGTYDNIITGLASDPGTEGSWTITNAGWMGSFSFDGSNNIDLTLTVTAVPEPGTWIGGSLALGALLLTQRRRFARLLKCAA